MQEEKSANRHHYCPECGVPAMISIAHSWLGDGSIVLAIDPTTRMALIESENFDPLYRGIGELIGAPIEHIVTSASRRATRSYMNRLIPRTARELVRDGDVVIDVIMDTMLPVAHFMGYGHPVSYEHRYQRDEGDYIKIRYTAPYSIPLLNGNLAGTVEAFIETDCGVDCRQLSPESYEITVSPADHPQEMKERMQLEPYTPGESGVDLPRCGTCGAPAALSGFSWDTEWGVIRERATGRRLAMLGPAMMDPVFDELEAELGSEVPEIVVEAERRFVRNGFYSLPEVRDENFMREALALRGLGNLTELKMGREGVGLRLENAAFHLMAAGLVQGLYELAYGREGKVEWELSREGLLEVCVTPWS